MPAEIKIAQFTLSQNSSSHSWKAQIALADKAEWQRFELRDPFVIQLGNVTYNLVVDNKQLQRLSSVNNVPVITALSPLSLHGSSRASRITKSWNTAVTAQVAVEEVLEQSIDWKIVNWTIEAGKLAFTDAYPLDIARTIINAAGGILRSNPDGTVKAEKAFPVSVKDWQTASIDHTLTDLNDNVNIIELNQHKELVNKVTISSDSSDSSQLQMQIDPRPEGLNNGKFSFAPGDTVGVLAFASEGVTIGQPESSSGTVTTEADQTFQQTQDLSFSDTDSATLSYPANSIESILWIGNDLGAIALDTDRRTALITTPGTGVCRVTYSVTAKAYKVTTEQSVSGLTEYPVQLHLEGETGTASSQRSIIGQRGDGDKQGVDISDPILTDIQALLARATTELDKGEPLQPVALECVHREGLEQGQIALIVDSQQAPNWRGMINGINHQYDGIKTLTKLDILRP